MESVEQAVAGTTISFKNVLLATDLSGSAEMALSYGRAFARDGADVHVVHVSGLDDYQLLCAEAFATTFDQEAYAGNDQSGALRELLQGLPREVPVHGRRVWEIIGDVARRNEVDLVIVGTHGRTGVPKLMLGSVAEEVLRDISCPVLTVGARAKAPNGGLVIKKVLLATDCSPHSLAPIYASSICERFGGELTVLVVGKESPRSHSVIHQEVREQITSIAPQLMSLNPKPLFLLQTGKPADKILQAAEDMDADLIILGAHHPRDVRTASHLPWAIATQVIARAHCPVLTVRDARATDPDERWNLSNSLLMNGR